MTVVLDPEPIRRWKEVILPYLGRKLKRRQTNNQPRRIEQEMEELAREYVETHEEIPYEVYKLATRTGEIVILRP
jgi:GTP cyclohydrolase I